MSYTDYLKELLRPLGVYDVEAPFNGGELTAAGEALDGALGALEEGERESSLVTARSWGLEGVAKLLLHRPAAETEEGLSQALAALLRIGDDSFTPGAIKTPSPAAAWRRSVWRQGWAGCGCAFPAWWAFRRRSTG